MAISIGGLIVTALGGAVLPAAGAALDIVAIASASFLVTPLVAAGIGTAVIAGTLIGLNAALTSSQSNPQAAAQTGYLALRQAVSPRSVSLGRVRVAGVYMLYESISGLSLDLTVLNHGGPIGGFVAFYFHDDLVAVNEDGTLNSADNGALYPDGRYDVGGFVLTRLGEIPETAYAQLVSALPGVWTDNHRLDGQASICMVLPNVSEATTLQRYPKGHPEPSAVIDATLVFDPRDEDQDRDDPSTWQVSYNPVINLLFVLTDEDRGLGFDWDTAIEPVLDELMAEADICDEVVTKKNLDTAARYACGGTYNLDNDPADIINPILASFDGWMTRGPNGHIALKAGKYRAPTVTFGPQDVIGVTVQRGVPDANVVNQYEISFTSPANKYKRAPGQPWRNEADIANRGKVRSATLDAPWVQSHEQLRRLAKRAMARQQAPLRGTLTTTLYGLVARGERWIRLQLPNRRGLENVVVEITGTATFDLVGRKCEFEWVVIGPATIDAWNAATEEGTEPPVPDDTTPEGLPVPDDVSGSPVDGNIDLSWDDPGRGDLTYVVRYRLVDAGSGDPGPWTDVNVTSPTIGAGRVSTTIFPMMLSDYEVQVASAAQGNLSAWSDVVLVTTS